MRSLRYLCLGVAVAALAAPAVATAALGDLVTISAAVRLVRVDPNTGQRTTVSQNNSPPGGPGFETPVGIKIAPNGDILVTDYGPTGSLAFDGKILRVDPRTGARSLLSSNSAPAGSPGLRNPSGIALEPGGDVIITDPRDPVPLTGHTSNIVRVDAATGARTLVTDSDNVALGPRPNVLGGVAIAPNGDILVVNNFASSGSNSTTQDGVIRIDPATGARSWVSRNGTPAGGPSFVDPGAITLEADGDILVSDINAAGWSGSSGLVIRVDPVTGERTAVTGQTDGLPSFRDPSSPIVEPSGKLVFSAAIPPQFFGNNAILRVDPATGTRAIVSVDGTPPGLQFIPNALALDPHPLSVSIGDATKVEGTGGASFIVFGVTRSEGIGNSSIKLTLSHVTTDAADFTSSLSATMNFVHGQTSGTFVAAVKGDDLVEPDETFKVTLSNPVGVDIADGEATGTIHDDDAVKLSVNDVAVMEGDSGTTQMTFTISRHQAYGDSSVDYAAAHVTTDGGDVIALPAGSVTFTGDELSKTVTVDVAGDTVVEETETFAINLSNPTGGVISDGVGTGTIINDDLAELSVGDTSVAEGDAGTTDMTFTVTRSAPVGYSAAGYEVVHGTTEAQDLAEPLSGYVEFHDGATTAEIVVSVNGDADIEGDETFKVALVDVYEATTADGEGLGTILDDDLSTLAIDDVSAAEGDGPFTFTVTRSTAAGSASVDFAVTHGSTDAGDFTGPLTGTAMFANGDATAEIVVDVAGDTLVEADETFTVALSNPVKSSIEDGNGLGTIVNDDVQRLSIDDVSVDEGNSGTTQLTFTVARDNSSQAADVTVALGGGEATPGSDYDATSVPVHFAPGEATRPATVSVNGDLEGEPDETFKAQLTGPSGMSVELADPLGIGTILNDDRRGTFGCRAQAAKVLGQRVAVANDPFSICADDHHGVARISAGTLLGLVRLSARGGDAQTDASPNGYPAKPADGDAAAASATAGELVLTAGLVTVRAELLHAEVRTVCTGGQAVTTATSRVDALVVNGVRISIVAGQAIDIPLLVGTLHINHRSVVNGVTTARALWLRSALDDVVIAEASAGATGSPCGLTMAGDAAS